MNPKITVCTATHRRPDLLARCIKSVQAQTFEDYEHIIFSDHCPKAKYVYEQFKSDERIRFFENQLPHVKNVGAVGQNFAINNSNSNLICYLNDDNIFFPNHLEELYNALQYHPIVFTRALSTKLGIGDNVIEKLSERTLEEDYNAVLNGEDVNESPMDMLRLGHHKNVIDSVGLWKSWAEMASAGRPDPHNEDGEFIARLATYGRVHYVNSFTAMYYDRSACKIKDDVYDKAIESVPEEQAYIFEESLKKAAII